MINRERAKGESTLEYPSQAREVSEADREQTQDPSQDGQEVMGARSDNRGPAAWGAE